ncbi:MAG: hypothetical protein IJL83_00350 [Clostridia bacterium]|nr:hypothetical protein [Clostridia bacterium]
MRRIPALLVFSALSFALFACGNTQDVTEYLSLPFSSEVKIVVDSSEYLASVERGGADLVSVKLKSPEAFSGLVVSLGAGSSVEFRGSKIENRFPRSVAELIYDAFSDSNRTEVIADGDVQIVRFSSRRGNGSIRVDGFTSVPISLESDGVYIEFSDFKR